MKTKQKPEPVTFERAKDSLPLFAVGTQVRVWYMGLLGPEETPPQNYPLRQCHIEGVRLKHDEECEWDEERGREVRTVYYREGWEYLAVAPDGSEDGWYSERALLEKGYRASPSVYEEMRDELANCVPLLSRFGRSAEARAAVARVNDLLARTGGSAK